MIDYLKQVLETWESSIITYFPKIFLAIVVLIVFWFLAKMGKKIGLNLYSESKKAHYHIANFIASLIYFFLILSGLFIALKIVGLEQMLSHLLAGAGVIGIIAGFAFKDIASNIFAGLLLNIQRPFRKDDWVQINDSFGVVLEVGWITTSIKTVPGQEVFVPNQLIYNSSYTNFSRFSKRRIILESGVSYNASFKKTFQSTFKRTGKFPVDWKSDGFV